MSNMREQGGFASCVMVNALCCLCLCLTHALDTLKPGEKLSNNETLVSAGGLFELGFFHSSDLTNHYLGIWFKKDKEKKAVWVANRDNPLIDPTRVLMIREDGNMVIRDLRMTPIIVNWGSLATSGDTRATLLDSGNLILMKGENIIWQSFHYPTDTFLPGMKIGLFDFDTNHTRNQFLVSWLSPSVPSSGSFALGISSENKSQVNVWHRDDYRVIGFWDGHSFRFLFQSPSDSHNFSFVSNDKDVYLTFNSKGNYKSSWFVLASTGDIDEYTLTEQGISFVNHSLCDGASVLNSKDCFNQLPFMCKDGNKFSEIKGSMPDSMILSGSSRLGLSDCEIMCRSTCSCTAFASLGEDGIGCELYFGDKRDLLDIIGKGNSTIYVRGGVPQKSNYQWIWWAVVVPVVSLTLLILIGLYCLRWRKHNFIGINWSHGVTKGSMGLLTYQSSSSGANIDDAGNASDLELGTKPDHELLLLNFSSLARATNNFSATNKLGEGGYGPVYKGKLSEQEIAVKRLSKSSGQGLNEFKNEVQLISKLQHRNLVKLLGCCIEQGEKILIYEYMPNKSLDSFIFDPLKRKLIGWKQRQHIIEGIAQGLLYLHKYSRLRIIHRDLKTSNILLDGYMNPKISDFGMARKFYDDESRAKTVRVAGTYGYMSPEYGVYGLFSTKSDVYSFGVILLEIVSGRRNLAFGGSDYAVNLLGHAWALWKAGRHVELMDPVLADSFSMDKLMVCIQVGLLCVQDNAEDRPTMSDVVSILSTEGVVLPTPRQPTFSTNLNAIVADSSSRRHEPSLNLVTISAIEAR